VFDTSPDRLPRRRYARGNFGLVRRGFDGLTAGRYNDFLMAKNYWLVKSEPESYSWATFVKEGGTAWTGVRNFTARNNLRAMKKGDGVLFYHSVSEKQVVGLAKVQKEAYADPTAKEGDWTAVDLAPVKALAKPVTLETLKTDKILKEMVLLRQVRLSVSPVTAEQYERLMSLAETK
jgi:predicted RNA-binding protein with PUA-like domain